MWLADSRYVSATLGKQNWNIRSVSAPPSSHLWDPQNDLPPCLSQNIQNLTEKPRKLINLIFTSLIKQREIINWENFFWAAARLLRASWMFLICYIICPIIWYCYDCSQKFRNLKKLWHHARACIKIERRDRAIVLLRMHQWCSKIMLTKGRHYCWTSAAI